LPKQVGHVGCGGGRQGHVPYVVILLDLSDTHTRPHAATAAESSSVCTPQVNTFQVKHATV
jgi:hypothetical protein